jgi:hypothetical protein
VKNIAMVVLIISYQVNYILLSLYILYTGKLNPSNERADVKFYLFVINTVPFSL